MYEIVKRIHFCYGHRLLDYQGKCAHPHGHNGVIEVKLASTTLDKKGMVLDIKCPKDNCEEILNS